MSNKLALITVSYNKKAIPQLLSSLEKQSNANVRLYIVDISGTTDPYPTTDADVHVIKRNNRGYAAGINEGIKEAQKNGYELFCAINDDTYVADDFVDSAISSLQKHPGTIIGGAIFYAPGYEYHKDLYSKKDLGKVFWYAGGYVDWAHSQPAHRGVDEVDANIWNKTERTSFITGCLMAFDAKTVQSIGYWDESYFLYYEDADYCERAKRKNVALIYDPAIRIWHLVSQSTDGSGSSLHRRYQQKNLLKFGLKYAPLKTKLHLLLNNLLRRGV